LERVQECISELDYKHFKLDYKTVDAVIRNFEIIGEASKNLSNSIKEKYNQVLWEEMYRLRNRISHEYFGINYEIIWDIANNHLPHNYKDITEILKLERFKKD